jgi:single-strand DNA-binding protein
LLNRVILIGRLTRDPELRYTQSGVAVASFTVAVDQPYTNQETGKREADFIDIVAWRKLAETCASHLGKGRMVGIEGSLRIRTYTANDGQKRRVAEVVADNVHFLDKHKEGTQGQQGQAQTNQGSPMNNPYDNLDLDDDVPF